MKELLPDLVENDSSVLVKSPVKFYSKSKRLAIDIADINGPRNKNSNKMKSLAFHGVDYMLLFPSELGRPESIRSYISDRISPDIQYKNYNLKKISEKEYRIFAKINSFRTLGRPSINYGIFISDVLYFTLSIRKEKNGYEIVNFARKNGEVSANMFNIMFNQFLIDFKPTSVVYFIDRRIDRYEYLLKIGFTIVGFGNPRWYLVDGETIIRNTNKYIGDKVWDCGTIKLRWEG